MITVFSQQHRLRNVRAERTEPYGGELVAPHECPERAQIVLDRVLSIGLGEVLSPQEFALAPVLRVHDEDYVEFLASAWKQWVAAQHLRDLGAARVTVLDVDFHHGNGTQDIFYDRADALYASLHGDPADAFPYFSGYADEAGRGASEGFDLNLPLPRGTAFAAWRAALAIGRIPTRFVLEGGYAVNVLSGFEDAR